MKKCLSLLLALCLCLGLFPTAAFAAEEDFVIEDGVLTKYNGPGGDVVIPDSVTEIDSFAFQDCAEMTSVVIPDSVSVIREDAFYNCTGLTELDLPDCAVEVEKGAFSTCTSLETASVPQPHKVRYDAFPIATKVNWAGHYFSITNGVLGSHTCSSSCNESDLVIPDGVTSIMEMESLYAGVFRNWKDLTSVTLPDSLTVIGSTTFCNCTGLTDVTLPDSLTEIGDYAFKNCTGLTSVTIPDGVISIGEAAFSGCTSLTSVTIPDGVTEIGDYAFQNTNLNSITLPSGVDLGAGVFNGCDSLRTVYFPDVFGAKGAAFPKGATVTTASGVDVTGFNINTDGVLTWYNGSGGDVTIFNGVTRIGSSAFMNCTGLTSVSIPNSVTEIGKSAFSGCTGLTSITIPSSVTRIADYAFYGCKNLKTATVPSSTSFTISNHESDPFPRTTEVTLVGDYFDVENGVLKEYRGPGGQVTIPDGVTEIGGGGYYRTTPVFGSNVTGVTIPSSVTKIGDYAFRNCTGLTSITIPDSVKEIGGSAFSGCTNLKTATVSSTTEYETGYYGSFPDTTEVILVGHDFTIKNGVLSGYRGPGGQVTIPNNVKEISGQYDQGVFPSNVTGVTIPGSVVKIGEYAFKNCTGLTSVTISSGVKTIDDNAFSGCTGLTGVTIPDSVISIGDSAFSGCTGLTSVTIPNSVKEIGSGAFNGCLSLTTAYVPSTTKISTSRYGEQNSFPDTTEVILTGHNFTIKNGVLSGYKGPGGAITIPDGVTRIASQAFADRSDITSVTFPGSLTAIDSYAFSNCIGLRSVELPSSVQVASNAFPSSTTVNRVGSYFDVQSGVLKKYVGPGGSITIPDGVTSIGAGVFASRTDITGVTIPGSVTEIGERAFQKCTGLTRLTLGSRVATIGGNAFEGCTGLTGVTFPGSMNSIGYQAFSGCTGLTSLNIPGSVKKIGGSAFSGCTGLTGVTLGSGLTELGSDAFRGCTGLKSITIPGSVTRLNSGTLDGCTGLTSLTVSPGVKEVSLGYGDAPNLKALSLPDSVEKVSVSSSTLRELVIPAGVTAWPTLNCPRLTKLTFPKDNWVFKGISRANFMKNVSNLTALNTIVNCPNEFVDDLVAPNATIRSNWTNPKSTIVTQSNRITQLSREITTGCTTDYDKAKAISQWVVDHIKYDDDYYYEGLKNYSDVPFDPEEILDKGNAVCAGYARLTQALLVAQKIPCLYVLGWTSGGYHAWNLAYLDGEYLWIDNTWGMDYFAMGVYKFSNDHKATGAASFNGVKGPGTLVQGEPLDAANMEKTSIGTALPETAEETLAREAIEALKEKYPDGMSWTNANSYYSEGLKSTGSGCAGFAYICSDAVFGKAPAAETHSSFDKIRVGDILRINNDTHSVVVLRKMSDGVIVTEGNYNGMIRWDRQISKAELEKGGLKVTTRWGTKAQEDAANTDIPAAGTAYPSTQKVSVDGKSVSFQCYALKDANGFDTNYIKLRDLADILSGTKAKFQVGWDGSVTITAGQGYTKNGSEQKTPFSGQRSYVRASAPTYVNGARAPLSAFVLNDDQGGGYTYYQLRDLGEALGFNVGWSADRGIFVETDKPYDANN